ncbi:hypothetical protein GARC_3525 [Paraglaciecola arctica BSs20135]|uniref:Uncharacterized protein n=1 Tax=Paraglaciecola arctica BSs20135 TaxID=493475 RepID=K6XIK0_9ALTE|nr:hypothetical protein GARC_3525 [Paraglaciecola arctica BSs20135]
MPLLKSSGFFFVCNSIMEQKNHNIHCVMYYLFVINFGWQKQRLA